MASESTPVVFLGVARIKDQTVLASCFDRSSLNVEKKGFESALTLMLERAASSAYAGWRERLDCQECDGVLHAFVDPEAVCVLVAGVREHQYPDRVALQLLRELSDKVRNSQGGEVISQAGAGQLSTPLRKLMRDHMKSYNDVGSQDKLTEVQQKVDALKGIMQDNVKKILETHATLESLDNNSASMSSQANRFLKQSVDLRRQMQYRNLKVKVLFGTCVLAMLIYVVQYFVDF